MANRLSKSRFQTGLQCPKALWLSTHARELADPTPETQQHIFDTGNAVGRTRARALRRRRACRRGLHPVRAGARDHAPAPRRPAERDLRGRARARRRLRAPRRARACRREPLGPLRGQVGHQGQAREHHRRRRADVGAGGRRPADPPRLPHAPRQHVRLRGRRLRPRAALRRRGRDRRRPRLPRRRSPDWSPRCSRCSTRPSRPRSPSASTATTPTPARFYGHCHAFLPEPPGHRAAADQRGAARLAHRRRHPTRSRTCRSTTRGLTSAQREVCELVRSGEPRIVGDVGRSLAELTYPIHFLDFETFMSALPLYPGTRPWQMITVPVVGPRPARERRPRAPRVPARGRRRPAAELHREA